MSEISHIVKSYEEELQNLNDNLIKMGSLVETQLSDSMEAIIKVDKDAAENIIKNDAKINELRATIEEQIVDLTSIDNSLANSEGLQPSSYSKYAIDLLS